ncbi:hypothetical protein GCM10009811_23840 [Nostocoides veronense]|uniref:Uncharacterized protein n=1 Tax=Nostocoides veronense TaxID=330836 RepID=A0ABN2LTM7_9MICO
MGMVRATPAQKRRVMSVSSWLGPASAATSTGSSAIPQMGHGPGPGRRISGCIGQVHSLAVDCTPGVSRAWWDSAPTSPGVNFAGSATNRSRQRSEQKWTCRPSFSTLSAVTGSTVIPQTGSVTAELG